MPTGAVTDARGAIAFVRKHGIVLVSARGPVPNLAEAIAGETIRGSWWGHAKAHLIFQLVNAVAASREILVCRLVGGKVTLVHERLWPALVRLERTIPGKSLAAVREEHTESGRHRTIETPFPKWVPDRVRVETSGLDEAGAIAAIGAELYASIRRPASKRRSRPMLVIAAIAIALSGGCRHPAEAPGPLDWTLGDWHGVRKAAETGQASPMIVKVEPLDKDGSRGQVERLRVDRGDRPYVGFTVRLLDPATSRWTMIYANSTRDSVSRLAGTIDGDRSTWISETMGERHGARVISERLSEDHWRRTNYLSENGGATWNLLFTDELERGAAPEGNK